MKKPAPKRPTSPSTIAPVMPRDVERHLTDVHEEQIHDLAEVLEKIDELGRHLDAAIARAAGQVAALTLKCQALEAAVQHDADALRLWQGTEKHP